MALKKPISESWAERAFFNGEYIMGGVPKRDIETHKAEYRAAALKALEATGADHAVFCRIEYDTDGAMESVHFYSNLTMDDNTFHERVRQCGNDFIGAVHKKP
jgi:hypothetical protein